MAFQKSNNEDLLGKRINDIEIVSIAGYKGNPPRMYYNVKCCRCGTMFELRRNKIFDTKHPPVACYECIKNKYSDPKYINEIIGKKINNLTCEKFIGFREVTVTDRDKPRREAMYQFKCDCGNTSILERNAFLSGKIKSCGCANTVGVIKHNESRTRLYMIWNHMRQRCTNPNNSRYNSYGERGILICNEWWGKTPDEGYTNFRDWALSNGYKDDLTIDRIDVNGPYAPWNCRWVTIKEQEWNKRNTRRVEFAGKMCSAYEIQQALNLSIDLKTLSRRLVNENNNYNDWSINDKLYIPAGVRREDYRKEHNITTPFKIIDKPEEDNDKLQK